MRVRENPTTLARHDCVHPGADATAGPGKPDDGAGLGITPRHLPHYSQFSFSGADRNAFQGGLHSKLYDKLGAHLCVNDAGVPGVHFSVWAPQATSVSVVGAFNQWDATVNRLVCDPAGIWEAFVEGVGVGELYTFKVLGAGPGAKPVEKSDPFAFGGAPFRFFQEPPKPVTPTPVTVPVSSLLGAGVAVGVDGDRGGRAGAEPEAGAAGMVAPVGSEGSGAACSDVKEAAPVQSAVVDLTEHKWTDDAWMEARKGKKWLEEPISIYEVHLGSFMRKPSPGSDKGSRDAAGKGLRLSLADILRLLDPDADGGASAKTSDNVTTNNNNSNGSNTATISSNSSNSSNSSSSSSSSILGDKSKGLVSAAERSNGSNGGTPLTNGGGAGWQPQTPGSLPTAATAANSRKATQGQLAAEGAGQVETGGGVGTKYSGEVTICSGDQTMVDARPDSFDREGHSWAGSALAEPPACSSGPLCVPGSCCPVPQASTPASANPASAQSMNHPASMLAGMSHTDVVADSLQVATMDNLAPALTATVSHRGGANGGGGGGADVGPIGPSSGSIENGGFGGGAASNGANASSGGGARSSGGNAGGSSGNASNGGNGTSGGNASSSTSSGGGGGGASAVSEDIPSCYYSYDDHVSTLVAYVRAMGFTHVELMPFMEHPFYGSWGYQVTGYFCPTSRYGAPVALMRLIDAFHNAGLGVIMDWVPAHFPLDPHGLALFDGTPQYEYSDARRGFHPDWKTGVFDYSKPEVRCFLHSSARFWLEHYHIDGVRVDAVASMLYFNYSRRDGEWLGNDYGGPENWHSVTFLRHLNEMVHWGFPGVFTIAEESTTWPQVSGRDKVAGCREALGFDFKWDIGWMNDTLEYWQKEPRHRTAAHCKLTFRNMYALSEHFVLPLSHDEVVHGKRSLLRKMPGDASQAFANLCLLLGYQYVTPGKKLLFMGQEFGQRGEWDHEGGLDWGLLAQSQLHAGVARWVAELNRVYKRERSLHEGDHFKWGFEWLDVDNAEDSVLVFLRKSRVPEPPLLVALNFKPVVREDYRIRVPEAGPWRVILNSDDREYGGSGMWPFDRQPPGRADAATSSPNPSGPFQASTQTPTSSQRPGSASSQHQAQGVGPDNVPVDEGELAVLALHSSRINSCPSLSRTTSAGGIHGGFPLEHGSVPGAGSPQPWLHAHGHHLGRLHGHGTRENHREAADGGNNWKFCNRYKYTLRLRLPPLGMVVLQAKRRECKEVTFRWTGVRSHQSVAVSGTFNDWQEQLPLVRDDEESAATINSQHGDVNNSGAMSGSVGGMGASADAMFPPFSNPGEPSSASSSPPSFTQSLPTMSSSSAFGSSSGQPGGGGKGGGGGRQGSYPPPSWSLRMSLPCGQYEYKFLVDGEYMCDGDAPVVCHDGTNNNNFLVVPSVGGNSATLGFPSLPPNSGLGWPDTP
eukprot:jgi/Mesvir1/5343/Mv15431-RA.1